MCYCHIFFKLTYVANTGICRRATPDRRTKVNSRCSWLGWGDSWHLDVAEGILNVSLADRWEPRHCFLSAVSSAARFDSQHLSRWLSSGSDRRRVVSGESCGWDIVATDESLPIWRLPARFSFRPLLFETFPSNPNRRVLVAERLLVLSEN